jgi:RNA polymerase sigma factor (sigma-70 family)
LNKEPKHIDTIIDGCKKNDPKAQEQLYRYFYQSMMGLCIRYTKCEEDSKLVLNSGFFKVFEKVKEYNPAKASFYTWIRMILVNCCLDHLKSKQRLVFVNELREAELLHIEPEVIRKMEAEKILHLIRNLPPATQAVFNLYIIDGYDHKEIASLLQISEGTSRWHLSEARKNLKLQLQKENTY